MVLQVKQKLSILLQDGLSLFELNPNLSVKEEIFHDSKIFFIDDFYDNPDEVKEYFLTEESYLNKFDQKPTFNNVHFEDRRHSILSEDIVKVYRFLQSVCNEKPLREDIVISNLTRFKKNKFNDYQNKFWWPHQDHGYNGVVYLNENDSLSGTNLYQCHHLNELIIRNHVIEHYEPWRSKENYKLIKSIPPKYNQLVLFDGKKFLHGMNICNDDYFSETYRLNQVFFFEQGTRHK